MITIKVHDQFVTWPNDIAILMMRYYKRHGVPFAIHRNCSSPELNIMGKNNFLDTTLNLARTAVNDQA